MTEGPFPRGAPPPPGGHDYGSPSQQRFAPPPQSIVMVPAPKNPGLAVALELLPGLFFQTFGIGHIYAGNVGIGLAFMFGYWALSAINFVLCFLFIGFVT